MGYTALISCSTPILLLVMWHLCCHMSSRHILAGEISRARLDKTRSYIFPRPRPVKVGEPCSLASQSRPGSSWSRARLSAGNGALLDLHQAGGHWSVLEHHLWISVDLPGTNELNTWVMMCGRLVWQQRVLVEFCVGLELTISRNGNTINQVQKCHVMRYSVFPSLTFAVTIAR